ncbi:MAG: hypothetical protein ACTSYI_17750 [Promethearchaeota archaeon]
MKGTKEESDFYQIRLIFLIVGSLIASLILMYFFQLWDFLLNNWYDIVLSLLQALPLTIIQTIILNGNAKDYKKLIIISTLICILVAIAAFFIYTSPLLNFNIKMAIYNVIENTVMSWLISYFSIQIMLLFFSILTPTPPIPLKNFHNLIRKAQKKNWNGFITNIDKMNERIDSLIKEGQITLGIHFDANKNSPLIIISPTQVFFEWNEWFKKVELKSKSYKRWDYLVSVIRTFDNSITNFDNFPVADWYLYRNPSIDIDSTLSTLYDMSFIAITFPHSLDSSEISENGLGTDETIYIENFLRSIIYSILDIEGIADLYINSFSLIQKAKLIVHLKGLKSLQSQIDILAKKYLEQQDSNRQFNAIYALGTCFQAISNELDVLQSIIPSLKVVTILESK